MDPSFYCLDADGHGMIFGQKDSCLVVEKLKVVSKASLAHIAAAFILNVFDRCRPPFSQSSYYYYERENSVCDYVIKVNKKGRDVLEALTRSPMTREKVLL